MKTLYKNLSTIAIILFIVGAFILTYFLYLLPSDVAKALSVIDTRQISLISSATKKVALTIGLEIGLGLLIIILMLNEKQNNNYKPVEDNDRINDHKNTNTSTDAPEQSSLTLHTRTGAINNLLKSTYPDQKTMLDKVLTKFCNELQACQGAIFLSKVEDQKRVLELSACYAYFFGESKVITYEFGEGLAGQVAKEGKLVNIKSIPQGYITILSGLGNSSPRNLIIAPFKLENDVIGVIEIASFQEFSLSDEEFVEGVSSLIAKQLTALPQDIEHV